MFVLRPLVLALLTLLAACSPETEERELQARGASGSTVEAAAPPALAPVADDTVRAESDAAPEQAGGDVLVTVVDGAGNPAPDVPVIGCELDEDGDVRGRLRWTFAASTDAAGVAAVPERRTGSRYAAALFGDGFALSTAEQPDRIVLPPHGALEIDVRALAAEAWVRVAPKDGRNVRFTVAAGEVLLIPRVPLGGRFEIRIDSDAGRAKLEAQGPTVEGETVSVVPEFARKVEVVAVLVDEEDRPLEGMRVLVQSIEDETEFFSLGPSDAEGRVAKPIPLDKMEALDGIPIEFLQEDLDELFDSDARKASVAIPALGDADTLDLGRVTMIRPGVLAAGRVVDERGEPVAGVDLDLDLPTDVADEVWNPWFDVTWLASTQSGADGRFELRAHTAGLPPWPGPLGLDVGLAEAPELMTVPFTAGQTDLVVRIERPGSLVIDLSRFPEAARRQFDIEVTPDRETARALGMEGTGSGGELIGPRTVAATISGEIDTDPYIESVSPASEEDGVSVYGLSAGTYSVEVTLGFAVLARVDDIVVRSGERVSDSRLDPLVFSVPLEPRTFTVLAAGKPVPDAELAYRDEDGIWWAPWDQTPMRTGALTGLVAPGGEIPVAARAPGYAPVLVTELPDGASVTLERLVEVTLEFRAPEEETGEAPDSSGFLLVATDPTSAWEQEFDHVIEQTSPSTYRLQLPAGVQLRVEGYGSPWWGQTFVVPASGGTVVLEAR